jgi:hypothetical protein
MVQLSTTKCSCIAISWVSLVSFAAITLCVASQRVFIVIYFVIDSVRKLLGTPSYILFSLIVVYSVKAEKDGGLCCSAFLEYIRYFKNYISSSYCLLPSTLRRCEMNGVCRVEWKVVGENIRSLSGRYMEARRHGLLQDIACHLPSKFTKKSLVVTGGQLVEIRSFTVP